MRITYSEGEVSLEATTQEFTELKSTLDNFIASPKMQLHVEAESGFDPSPYDALLSCLIFQKSEALIQVRAEGSALCIEGAGECLAKLAANLPYDAEDPETGIRYHIHFDHVGWPSHVAANSADLILCVQHVGG